MLETDERLQRALDVSYAYVNRRERTVGEVRRHLERHTIDCELIDIALQTLTVQGFLDDVRFAQLFVTDKRELEQWGNERIRRRLIARGVERELAEQALAQASDRPDDAQTEIGRALALLARRFPAPLVDRRERERALGVLIRKGYESELALDALHAHAATD